MKNLLSAIFFALISGSFIFAQEIPTKPSTGNGTGRGSGVGSGTSKPIVPNTENTDKTSPLRILSKSPASYTDAARQNGIEGTVRLRVTFLASGEIGSIAPVSGLPFGLTEYAIAAARNIKFEPATKNGIPISVTKLVEYNFSILYKENDKDLEKNAEILEKPQAERPQESNLQNISGKVKALVAFNSSGDARIIETYSDLPKEFIQKVTEAVALIKFKPAIHKNGKTVTQIKEIEYEFSKQ